MRVLQRNATVKTRFGGQFVQSIGGVSGGRRDGRPVDWFIYVNGILTDEGAGAIDVRGGDRIWWDHHDWGVTPDVRAVVGSYPEPFLHGSEGKRLPVRVECADPHARRRARSSPTSCSRSASRSAAATSAAARRTRRCGSSSGRGRRLRVATRRPSRSTPARARAACSPASRRAARSSSCWTRAARAARMLGAGSGLVAATRVLERQPLWFVTGTDEAGVDSRRARARRGSAGQPLRARDLRRPAGGVPARATAPASSLGVAEPRSSPMFYVRRASPLHAARAPVAAAYACALVTAVLAFENPLVLAAIGLAIAGAALLAARRPRAAAGGALWRAVRAADRARQPARHRRGPDGAAASRRARAARQGRRHARSARLRRDPRPARAARRARERRAAGRDGRRRRAAARLPAHLGALGADRGARRAARAGARPRRPAPGRRAPLPARRDARVPAPPSACRSCARSRPARSTARSTSRRRSRCAATRRPPRGRAPRRARAPWSRHDLAFAASAAGLVALAAGARLLGVGEFDAYPSTVVAAGAREWLLALALVAVALLPFADRRGIVR